MRSIAIIHLQKELSLYPANGVYALVNAGDGCAANFSGNGDSFTINGSPFLPTSSRQKVSSFAQHPVISV